MHPAAAQVVYVTGKGGVGKSYVAGLLAQAGAARGQRTALVEMREAPADGDSDHRTGRVAATDDTTGATAAGAGRGRAAATAATSGAGMERGFARVVLDRDRALRHLLTDLLRFRFLSNRLMSSTTFAAVAAAAPGLKDLVYVAYLCELAAGNGTGRYDLLVVDGVASGHSVPLLTAPHRVRELVPFGPAARIAAAADELLHDHTHFRAAVVTLAEELAITETAELLDALAHHGIAATAPIINGIYPSNATAEQAAWLYEHPVSHDARLYLARRQRQLELADRLPTSLGEPLLLPFLFDDDVAGAGTAEALLGHVLGATPSKR